MRLGYSRNKLFQQFYIPRLFELILIPWFHAIEFHKATALETVRIEGL
jgi:hypothetical protein